MIDRVNITKEDVLNSKAFSLSNQNHRHWFSSNHYINSVGGWLTVCKYKGIEKMLSSFHLTDFEKELIKELHNAIHTHKQRN